MFWDIFLGASIEILVVFLLVLGGFLTSTKAWHRWAFLICGPILVLLTMLQTYRTSRTLDRIEHNPPQVTVNVPPSLPPQIIVNPPAIKAPASKGFMQFNLAEFIKGELIPGQAISLNLSLINKGIEPVDDMYRFFALTLGQVSDDEKTQGKRNQLIHSMFFKEAIKSLKETKKQLKNGLSIGIGDIVYNTFKIGPFTQEQTDDLINGKLRLYVYAWARWKDEVHDLDSCLWLQAPHSTKLENLTWHVCPPLS